MLWYGMVYRPTLHVLHLLCHFGDGGVTATSVWAQIHRYCLKIYPKMCHKIILRQKLRCRKSILRHILG